MSRINLFILPLAAAAAIFGGWRRRRHPNSPAWRGAVVTPGGRTELTLTIDAEGQAGLDNTTMGLTAVPVDGPTITDGEVRFRCRRSRPVSKEACPKTAGR